MEGGSMIRSSNEEEDDLLELPPGFRFHPTDEEIIMHYLLKKVIDRRFTAIAIGQADFNKCEPWDLPNKAKTGEKERFFFCHRDRKYPTGMRTNRATESGYWKATGKDKEIYKIRTNWLVGMKKTLVFYKGRAPKGEKTNWVMHEYRLEGSFSSYNLSRSAKEAWVVCKVMHKNLGTGPNTPAFGELQRIDSFVDRHLDSPKLPPLQSCSHPNIERPSSSSIATDDDPEFRPRTSLNSYKLQVQHDQKSFLVPHHEYTESPLFRETDPLFDPNPSAFHYQASYVGSQYHDRAGAMSAYNKNIPFKGIHQVNSRLPAHNIVTREPGSTCKIENFSSNSVVSYSQDTGISTEMANEITSTHSREESESKKPFDQELEGLNFSVNMSDLDSLWSY